MSLFGRKGRERDQADAVYAAIVGNARAPEFYRDAGIPDTLEGRFETLVLLGWLYFRRLRSEDEQMRRLGQAVFDSMFRDMDASLRELGVGDLTVPKKIRAMGEAFYGRATAYDAGMADASGEALVAALARNFWPDLPAGPQRAAGLARWVIEADVQLAGKSTAELRSADLSFPAPRFAAGNAVPMEACS